LAEQQTL